MVLVAYSGEVLGRAADLDDGNGADGGRWRRGLLLDPRDKEEDGTAASTGAAEPCTDDQDSRGELLLFPGRGEKQTREGESLEEVREENRGEEKGSLRRLICWVFAGDERWRGHVQGWRSCVRPDLVAWGLDGWDKVPRI